jgi:hypothetical protein
VDLIQRQHVFSQVMESFLKRLEYEEAGRLLRWFPLGKGTPVVLDPRFSFGAPTVLGSGVPTVSLDRAQRAAVEFERSLVLKA